MVPNYFVVGITAIFRNLLLGVFILAAPALCAQQTIDTSPPPGYYTPDWVFANLDLSGLSTGLLQEHGTPFTRLSAFNGDPDSTTISTPLRCRLVQATLLSATVNANAQVDTAALPAESGSDTFDYQILLYAYHKLKPDAVSQNLISITNNQLVDISGPQDSPYKREFAIAAAPWRKKALTAGQVYVFSPTVATNIPAQFVSGYEINTGQGFTAVAPGSVYTFTASSGSEMDFEARVTLTNGKVLLSRSKMAKRLRRSHILISQVPTEARLRRSRMLQQAKTNAPPTPTTSPKNNNVFHPLS